MKTALRRFSEARKEGYAALIARKDAEIAALRAEVDRQQVWNVELRIENRQLHIRNSELNAAYTGLREILRSRGVPTP